MLCRWCEFKGNYFRVFLLITMPFLFMRISAALTAKMKNQLPFTILFVMACASTVRCSYKQIANNMSKLPAKAPHVLPINVNITASNTLAVFITNTPREKVGGSESQLIAEDQHLKSMNYFHIQAH